MPSHSSPVAAAPEEVAKSPAARRLIAAAVMIGLAIGALALVDRMRERPLKPAPPHEPSQALITTPAAEPSAPAAGVAQPTTTAPPPPLVLNNETLAPPRNASGALPTSSPVTGAAPVENAALVPGKAYMIQVGVFSSPANAQALQKQLQHAGMEARLETRVQLGPFKDRREADKALARAKKLGINAVIVSAR